MQPSTYGMIPVAKRPEPAPRPAARPYIPVRHAVLPEHLTASGSWAASAAFEPIQVLASHVLARYGDRPFATVAVTSSLPSEGKTTVALSLALRLATARRKRVLVVDFDLHRGSLSREVCLHDSRGLLDRLAGDSPTAALPVYPTDCPGLSVAPCGRMSAHARSPLPDRDQVCDVLEAARHQGFDLALVDCPPLVPVADAQVIGGVADGAILVVRAYRTPRKVIEAAIGEFGRDRFFACVLNRASPDEIPYFRDVYAYYRSPRD